MQVAVVGGAECSPEVREAAEELGRRIARAGHILICGGRGGVMEAAAKGAREGGGLTVGILPGDRNEGNPFLDIEVATGMGHARNAIIVRSADVVIALPGEHGTLSEMAHALKMERLVISLNSWDVPGAVKASTIDQAVEIMERGC
ncbi:MAG: TIGR00725 family protein [Methanosarcinales archaeon]|nr:TIGR00725 family protein [Methanosarcinales archaeon]